MRTEQLIDLLARQAGPAPRRVVEIRLVTAMGFGVLVSAAAAVGALGLNADLANMPAGLALKVAYVVCLVVGAASFADRVSRPGAPWRRAALNLTLVLLAMTTLAAIASASAPGTVRLERLLGRTWVTCPWLVAVLGAPALAALLWAMRGLAPTRPRLGGLAAGLLAGSLGALGYTLHCPEMSPEFVVVWYTLGVLVLAGVGAALGPWLLRW